MKLAKVPHELIYVSLFNAEHRTEEMLKMNPTHKLPYIQDTEDGLGTSESGAIVRYVANKLGLDTPLYPINDLRRRALIDRFLDWTISDIRKSSAGLYGAALILRWRGLTVPQSLINQREEYWKRNMLFLDEILSQQEYVV